MNKKLMAVAVAGAFAVPGIASAQVTVSGKMGIQLSNIKIGDALPARAGLNKSETFMNDNASIIRIGAREDLGGGMEAFGQYEFRPVMDGNSTGPAGSMQAGSPTGVTYVGLRSNAWGSVRAGTDVTWSQSGEIKSASSSQHFSSSPVNSYLIIGGTSTSFASSRSRNLIIYDTPDFKNGFKFTGMWSASAATDEADLLTGARKGQNWFLFPEYSGGNWKVGYSYMKMKFDGVVAATTPLDLDGHKIYGDMSFGGGFDANVSIAKHKGKNGSTGVSLADVKKTIVSARYTTGSNVFAMMYGVSADDKVQAGDQKYTLTGLTYNYNFSRRTNMGLTWVRMKNAPGSNADITSTTTSSYATAGASANLGEDQTLVSLSLNHNF
jgi:predicted porin